VKALEVEFTVACSPEHAFDVWARKTSLWWPRAHSRSGDPGLTVAFEPNAFTRDTRGGASRCYGACAAAWPVYFTKGQLRAGEGVRRSLIGTTRRRDGRRQLTYNGWPLYYYVGDRSPGQVLCQNVDEFGGTWLVVRPTGGLVR
jgi:predicted lipoprotein with Yx(FWY)xxD motif